MVLGFFKRCEWCGYREIGHVKRSCIEEHHIVKKRLGGSDDRLNIIRLCRNCHNKAYNEQISEYKLKQIVIKREVIRELVSDCYENEPFETAFTNDIISSTGDLDIRHRQRFYLINNWLEGKYSNLVLPYIVISDMCRCK